MTIVELREGGLANQIFGGPIICFYISRIAAEALEAARSRREGNTYDDRAAVLIERDYFQRGGACRVTCPSAAMPYVRDMLQAAIIDAPDDFTRKACLRALEETVKMTSDAGAAAR